jgi:hypothetical protein
MSLLKKAPAGVEVLDLVAARAARAEARAGQALPVIKVSAGFVEIKAEFDLSAGEEFATGNLRAGLAKLVADPADVDLIMDGGLSKDDLESITQFVVGKSLGESEASAKLLKSVGKK